MECLLAEFMLMHKNVLLWSEPVTLTPSAIPYMIQYVFVLLYILSTVGVFVMLICKFDCFFGHICCMSVMFINTVFVAGSELLSY